MNRFDHIKDPTFRARLLLSQERGAFQGWIGDYEVRQKNGETHGYHRDNGTAVPEYIGSEAGLYVFAGRKPYVVSPRRW